MLLQFRIEVFQFGVPHSLVIREINILRRDTGDGDVAVNVTPHLEHRQRFIGTRYESGENQAENDGKFDAHRLV